MSHQICLKWNNHMTMIDDFKNYLLTQTMVDVTLACDGKSLKAHKLVLAACSPFFQTLFKENPCKHPIVILQGMKYTELKAVIDFIYDGEVNVTEDRLEDLIKTAETLRVKVLGDVMIATDESETQFGAGSEMQTDDGLQKQPSEETVMQLNEEIENRFNEGMETQFNEGMETQFNEGMETQFHEVENQFNEGVEKQDNEGVEKQDNEGVEKQSNEEMKEQSDEGVEKQSNEGAEKQSNDKMVKEEKQSKEEVEKQSDDILENQLTGVTESPCVVKSENEPSDELSHQPLSSSPSIKRKRGRPRKSVKFQNEDEASKAKNKPIRKLQDEDETPKTKNKPVTGRKLQDEDETPKAKNKPVRKLQDEDAASKVKNKLVDDLEFQELPLEVELHTTQQQQSTVPLPSCSKDSSFTFQLDESMDDIEGVVLEDSFENATLNNLIAEQASVIDDSKKQLDQTPSCSKGKKDESKSQDTPFKLVPIPSLPDSFVVLQDVMTLIHTTTPTKTPPAVAVEESPESERDAYSPPPVLSPVLKESPCKKLQIRKKAKPVPIKIEPQPIKIFKYPVSDSDQEEEVEDYYDDDSPSRKILKEKIENSGLTASWVKMHKCTKCSFKSKYAVSLKRHVIAKHVKTKNFKCELCDFATTLKQHLTRHTSEVHQNVWRYQCSDCPYRSSQQANVRRHYEMVHECKKPYECDQCGLRSAQRSHIKKHVMAVHQQRRDYTCDFCTYRCASKENLKRHYRLLHKITTPNALLIN